MAAASEHQEAIRASVAAFELLRLGRWKLAEQAFASALGRAGGEGEGGPATQRQQMLVGRAEALIQLGDMAPAERCLFDAFASLGQPRPEGATPDFALAQALQWLARLRLLARRPADAVALLRLALEALPQGDDEPVGSRWAVLRARIREQLAVGLSASGEVEAALKLHGQALAVFEHPLHVVELARDRAVALVNSGVGEWLLGRNADALAHLNAALAVFGGLFDAGGERERADVARTQMNLGGVLTSCGDFEAALAMFDAAAKGYDAAIARAAGRADLDRLRASRAQTEMNHAYTLFKAGKFDAAARRYRLARRRYAALALAQPRLRDDEARTWVNQAHLLARQGRSAPARRLYARGWKALAALCDDGQPHLAADVANARLGLARMLLAQGRAAAAALHFEGALSALVALTEHGQLQHARAWLVGLADHATLLIERGLNHPQQTPGCGEGDPLLRALAHPPRYGLTGLAARLEAIDTGLERLEGWSAAVAAGPHALPWYGAFAGAFLLHLLDATAQLLGDSDPHELRSQWVATQAIVPRLYRAARSLPRAPHLLADWFLRTRGLRAQRSALAAGGDVQLVELRELLAQLRRLEEEMLAEPAAADGAGRHPGPSSRAASSSGQRSGEADAARWRALRTRCDALRERLAKAGRLPVALRLDARALAARMRPRGVLLMLARCAPEEILAVALHRPGAIDGSIVAQRTLSLDAPGAAVDCVALNRLLRRAMGSAGAVLRRAGDGALLEAPAAGPTMNISSAEQAARDFYERIAEGLLRPLLRQLAAQGLGDVSLVPSADLHLLPYHEVLEATLAETGCALSVYPSCGAWAQHRVFRPGRALKNEAPAPAWAVVAEGLLDAGLPLHWAVLERRLTLRLWAEAGAPVQVLTAAALQADGVTALIGVGHGSAPADNPARGGLRVGEGRELSAHDLPRIRTCHRVILSCCVLGRVDEVHTEAMGFLSSSFGYATRFGAGWLIEVPDAEACLFGAAFQFALRRAHAAPAAGRAPHWNEVFHAVRRQVRDGRWPPGFGAWLADALPAAIEASALPGGPWLNRYEYLRDFDGGLFARPPASLRRLMPWAVTLGR